MELGDFRTLVYVDVSNIRTSCLRSCGFRVDFVALYKYIAKKYPQLEYVGYYEGIAKGDEKKTKEHERLRELGYSVRSLVRRRYVEPPVYSNIACRKCDCINKVEVRPYSKKLKSNVDVYLASEMLKTAIVADVPTHIIIFSCDGDYAEAIKIAAENPNVRVTVIATPPIEDFEKNTLSVRLKELREELGDRYSLTNIADIQDLIQVKYEDDKNESGSEDTLSTVGNTSPVF